jgi:hypothetical protein
MSHYDPSQPAQSQRLQPGIQTQTEWQRIPTQPLPQLPSYQPTFHSRSPEKKARSGLLITIGAIVVMLALLGLAFYWQNQSAPAPSKPATAVKQRQRPTPTIAEPSPLPTLPIQVIGRPVVVDSTWTITVNAVKTYAGDPFSMPAAGNTFLVVDVTVKNTSRHYQDMESGIQLLLKDSAGQQYRETITDFATPPDGSIKFGQFQRGQLAYEIPATMHTFYYFFQADASGTDMTEWVLNV